MKKEAGNNAQKMSLWIDGYDDLFSDFDPRPFSERNISDDFLHEVKKVAAETNFRIEELRLLIPHGKRNPETEAIITGRLHQFLVKNRHYFVSRKKKGQIKGALFALAGIILMASATIVSAMKAAGLFMHILFVIFEPAGWFFVWAGLENLIQIPWKEKAELDFYSKMIKTKITFLDMT